MAPQQVLVPYLKDLGDEIKVAQSDMLTTHIVLKKRDLSYPHTDIL